MKKKLLIVVLVLSFSINFLNAQQTFTPADCDAAAMKAATRLVSLQADIMEDNAGNGFADFDPDDGGWNIAVDPSATGYMGCTPSPVVAYGACGISILETYTVCDDESYLVSCLDVYAGALGRPLVRGGLTIYFLIRLTDVTGNMTFVGLAKERYDDVIAFHGSAENLAVHLRNMRHLTGLDGLIPWDISLYVRAAANLHRYYPTEVYDEDADDMMEVLYQDMIGNPGYFDPSDPTEKFYYMGLAGGILASIYSEEHLDYVNSTLLPSLKMGKNPDGSWQWNGVCTGGDYQTTAYSILALSYYAEYYGLALESDEISLATDAAAWLHSEQKSNGGWWYPNLRDHEVAYPYTEEEVKINISTACIYIEYPGVDSECTWALRKISDVTRAAMGMNTDQTVSDEVIDSGIVNNPDAGVTVYVTGSCNISIVNYSYNPGTSIQGIDRFFDVQVDNYTEIISLEIRMYYSDDEAGDSEDKLKLYYWNGSAWNQCSNTGVDTTSNYVWAVIDSVSNPTLQQLEELGAIPFTAMAPMQIAEYPIILTAILAIVVLAYLHRN